MCPDHTRAAPHKWNPMVALGRSSPREGLAVTLTACNASRRSAPCAAWHDNARPLSAQRGLSVHSVAAACAPRMSIARLWAAVLPAAGSAGCGSGAKRPAARWGDSSSAPSRGWHATHEGSSVLGDQPLARRPSGESRCRPCAQSLPQTHTPCRPRLAARMH